MLRDALSDDASEPRYVESIRGQGYRLIADVEIIKRETAKTPSSRKLLLLGATAIVIAALFLIGTSLIDEETTPSVAVLPFPDLSAEQDQGYFCDGLTDELISRYRQEFASPYMSASRGYITDVITDAAADFIRALTPPNALMESGAKGMAIRSADEIVPTLKAALAAEGPVLIDVPIDYSDNSTLFEEVDLLDVGGPYEVFLTTSRLAQRRGDPPPFEVFTMGLSRTPVTAYGGLRLTPDRLVDETEKLDILVVPGALAIEKVSGDPALISAIGDLSDRAELTTSVCTGAFLLSTAGLLETGDAPMFALTFVSEARPMAIGSSW